ncbi:MAG: putative Ig domain-containing protein [Acidobacteriota bacterium]|nr:putative Ig domain-containing protein [Acidobacteriota bacterium]
MMRGYLDNGNGQPTTVTFSGLATGTYDVYVYVDGDNGADSRTATYQLSGPGASSVGTSPIDAPNTDFTGSFIRASNSIGNYVLFSSLKVSSTLTLTATPGAAGWAARAPVNGIQIIPVSVPQPDFTIAATPGSQTIIAGKSTTFNVAVGQVTGFVGTVGLSATSLPAGATASFSPAAITTSGTSTLTITTIGSTPPGTSALTIKGVSGSLSHSASVSLVVGAPPPVPAAISIDFVGNGTAMAATETAGVVTKSNWNSAVGASSSSPLALVTETGSATGASVQWTSDGGWGTSISDLAGNNRMMRGYLDAGNNPSSVTVNGLVAGVYDVYAYVDGDNGGSSRTGNYQIKGPGITTASINLVDAPNVNFNGTMVQANNSAGNYVLFGRISVGSSFTLTATPGAADWAPRAPLNGIQIVPSVPDFSVSVTPSSQAIVPGGSLQFTVSVNALNGFNGLVNLTAGGLPSGASISFTPTSLTGSGSTTGTLKTSTTTQGTSTLTINATSGALNHSATATVTVSSTVQIALTPSSTTLMAAQTAQFTPTIAGSSNTTVTWALNPAVGTISASGMYTAPASVTAAQSVTVSAISTADSTKSATAALTLIPSLTVTTASIPNATAGTPYSTTLAASGAKPPYTWSVSSGTLPAGLILSSAGTISGTAASGSYSFTATVRDSAGNQASQSYALSVSAAVGAGYYVSALNGNDSWSGLLISPNQQSTDGPFKTLSRAQGAIQGSTTIKNVIVRAGTYSIASGMNFASPDNGDTWLAYPGEVVILEGSNTGRININGTDRFALEGFQIQNMGAGGLDVGYSTNAKIRWNTFLNNNQNAISGYWVVGATIDSNTINGQFPGTISGGRGSVPYWAIELGIGCNGTKITHNMIKNTQGGGVNFGAGPTDAPNNNVVMDRNVLVNVNTSSWDTGALYFYDMTHVATGLQITNNIVNGNGDGTLTDESIAIYLDAATSNALVSGNLCRTCGQFGLHMNWGDHNTVVNNIFDLSSGAQIGIYQDWIETARVPGNYGMVANTFAKNIVYFAGGASGATWTMNTVAGDSPPADSGNLYYSATGQGIPNNLPVVDSAAVYANPQFADPNSGNYSMSSSSPAFSSIQFTALATDQGPVPYAP